MKVPYYDVPPCPRCASLATGRLVTSLTTSPLLTFLGHIIGVRFVSGGEHAKVHNCVCCACGFRWRHDIPTRWVTFDEFLDAAEARYEEENLLYDSATAIDQAKAQYNERTKEKTAKTPRRRSEFLSFFTRNSLLHNKGGDTY